MKDILNSHEIVKGNRIAYGIHGEGEPLVLIHGTPSHSFEWRDIIPRLTSAGYQVYVYDLLGYGGSERPLGVDTSVGGQGPILEALLDKWGLNQAHIVAHDIGGAIGMRFAIFRPERVASLTIIDSVSYDSWPSETWQKIIHDYLDDYAAMSEYKFRQLLTNQLRMTVYDESKMTGETLESYLSPHEDSFGRVSFFYHQVRHYDSRYTEEITSNLKNLSMPVQIIWGEEDRWQPITYAKRLAEDIPGSELHIIPKAGHFIMEDAPDTLSEHIISFINSKRT